MVGNAAARVSVPSVMSVDWTSDKVLELVVEAELQKRLLPREELLEESDELGECLQLQRWVPSLHSLVRPHTIAEWDGGEIVRLRSVAQLWTLTLCVCQEWCLS